MPHVIVFGVKYPLRRDNHSGVWSIRKRTSEVSIYENLGVTNLKAAQAKAKEHLEKWDANSRRLMGGRATLQEVADAYLAMPKRASEAVGDANAKRFAVVVETAWGRKLADVTTDRLNEGRLWEDYATARHKALGLSKLDLSTRREENRGINAAIRMAVSMFHKGLHEGYKRKGIALNFPAIQRVQYLPIIKKRVPLLEKKRVDKLTEALPGLKAKDRLMWRAIMLARYAGLRSKEIRRATRDWLDKDTSGLWRILIHDRPEIGFQHKTGADYVAPILSRELVEDLRTVKSGLLVPTKLTADHFFKRLCNDWLRQFIPPPNKGMHRLRALYLDQLRAAMGKAILADMEAVEKAKDAAGHTTSKTTKGAYLGEPMIRAH